MAEIESVDNIEYIHYLVKILKANELRDILFSFNVNKYGKKKCLCKRILNLLSDTLPNTKLLRHKIMDVYKSRELPSSNHQPEHAQQQQQQLEQQPQQQQRASSPPIEEFQPLDACTQFESLPFFKTIKILLTPIRCESFDGVCNFNAIFYLADNIRHSVYNSWSNSNQDYTIKIILRLVQIEDEENFPQHLPRNLVVAVNGCNCKLPAINIPIDITGQTDLPNGYSQNTLSITWSKEPCQYIAGVYVAHKLTGNDLVKTLKKKPLRNSELTKKLIQQSMENDAEMNIDTIIATINDPLTKRRMELPSKGANCVHLQCFDAVQFLQMNELKQTWVCPLCMKKVKFEDIEIDEFFLNILQSNALSKECESIVLSKNGSWTEKKIIAHSNNSILGKNQQVDVFTLSDDEDIEPKAKRPKYSPLISSKYVEKTQNLMKKNFTNSTGSDLVLNPSLKNYSTSSTNSEYQSINKFQTNYVLPNIPNTGFNYNKPSTSRSQEEDKPRSVLCVITLD